MGLGLVLLVLVGGRLGLDVGFVVAEGSRCMGCCWGRVNGHLIRLSPGGVVEFSGKARCVFVGPTGWVDLFCGCAGDGFWGIGWVQELERLYKSLGLENLDTTGHAVGIFM